MVCYCCVKGCSNNSNDKKKNPSNSTSFHAFPTNQEQRIKWLRAIGRPNWEPPSHARICSAHFDYDQINHDSCRTRIKDDACPVNALPPNSNFEASFVEVCRICLATDLKMYSLENSPLKDYLQSIAGFNANSNYNIEGLPQFVCYECAAHLTRCYNLIERSMTAQATLLDIFAQNGQITKSLIRARNREKLNLNTKLKYNSVIPTYLLEYKYDDINKTSYLTHSEFVIDDHKMNEYSFEFKDQTKNHLEINVTIDVETKINKSNDEYSDDDEFANEMMNYPNDTKSDSDNEKNASINIPTTNKESSLNIRSAESVLIMNECSNKKEENFKQYQNETGKKKSRRMLSDGLTPNEIEMQKYFNIIKLTSQEQIEEWTKSMENTPWKSDTVYKCEVCSKIFAHIATYRSHIIRHDPSRGKAECPICKLRFKNIVVVRSHTNRAHGKKFHCKSCPKVFSNVAVAKKHQKWHSGYQYSCGYCSFRSMHESALGGHVRVQHRHQLACTRCGRPAATSRGLRLHRAAAHHALQECEDSEAFPCEQCHLKFSSEGARRVHILTSKQHRQKTSYQNPNPHEDLPRNTCKFCGLDFPTATEVLKHTRAEHRKLRKKKTSWRLPDDSYPTQCEHCDIRLESRGEHWQHVRRQHPRMTAGYRRVITAVCHVCGKGFQNKTKLELHALRHGRPTVRCRECGRACYDKHALARHAATHAPHRPHACARCGRAFKLRSNLLRHARVCRLVLHLFRLPFFPSDRSPVRFKRGSKTARAEGRKPSGALGLKSYPSGGSWPTATP